MLKKLSKFGVGVVGTGFMGVTHVEALRRLGLNVIGICGSSPEAGQNSANDLNLPIGFESYEALLAHPQINCVHLTVPNHLHFPMIKLAIVAQKHVLCEKPLVLNSQEADALNKFAAESSSVIGVNYNLRYYPLCFEVKSRIAQGELGKLAHISGGYLQDWLLYPSDFNWRVLKDKGGPLRAIADIGTHWMDMIQHVTGLKIQSVCAQLSRLHDTRIKPDKSSETFSKDLGQAQGSSVTVDTEDFAHLWIKLTDGTMGSALISQIAAGRKNKLYFEISGSKSSLAWNGESPNELWIGHRDSPNQRLIKDPTLMSEEASQFSSFPPGHAEGYPDTFKQCFRDFYEYLASDRTGEKNFPTLEDGQHEIRLCDAILQSHETQRWVLVKGD